MSAAPRTTAVRSWRTRRTSGDVAPTRSRRRRQFVLALIPILAGLAFALTRHRQPTEPVVVDGGLRIKVLDLRDTAGRLHTADEWQGRPAVVLFFLGVECPVSNGHAPDMARLAAGYARRGVAFYGIHPDPDVTPGAAAEHAKTYALPFPILLDPTQAVARQARVRVTPEAVVLADDGQVLYRGRIDDRYSPEGKRRDQPSRHDLVSALDAVLADELPAVAVTTPFGCPLPPARSVDDDAPVTFNRDVAPILWRNCTPCHRPGEVAPFSLLTYRDAARRADFLKEITASKRMPPWKPEPGWGLFHDDLRLADSEIATLARWANGGAEEGDPADLSTPPSFPDEWALGEPDLVVPMPEPFTVLAGGTDVYQIFLLPVPIDRDRTVAAVDFRPDNRRVVHHARILMDGDDELRARDRADPSPGFRSWGGVDVARPGLAEWIPGTTPRRWPDDAGKVIKAGNDLVLLVHYHPTGKPEVDRSRIGLYFREGPPKKPIAGVPLATAKIDIPPGEANHQIKLTATMPADAHAIGLIPHAHFLLREMKLTAELPDGRAVPMLWIKDWDFNWQGQYQYLKPLALPKGTKLHLLAIYDNSAENPNNPNSPPKRVRYGPNSTDEMLGCHVQVTPDTPEAYEAIRAKWPKGL